MTGNGNVITVYVAYGVVAVALTAWLARTLSHNGAVFLEDVFKDRPGLATAVNRLLVVGFYMLNLGYAFWILRAGGGLDAFSSVQYFVNRLAILLVTAGPDPLRQRDGVLADPESRRAASAADSGRASSGDRATREDREVTGHERARDVHGPSSGTDTAHDLVRRAVRVVLERA